MFGSRLKVQRHKDAPLPARCRPGLKRPGVAAEKTRQRQPAQPEGRIAQKRPAVDVALKGSVVKRWVHAAANFSNE